MTRVLLVDDHPLFLDGVRAALSGDPDLEVVGTAEDLASALAEAAALEPDVVLMDLNLPDGSGIDATRRILAVRPSTRAGPRPPAPVRVDGRRPAGNPARRSARDSRPAARRSPATSRCPAARARARHRRPARERS